LREDAESAAAVVKNRISQLRKLLGDGELLTEPSGYLLRVGPDDLDVLCFRRFAEAGRRELAAGRPARAASLLGQALELWRGRPLADFSYDDFAQGEMARLEELRIVTIEDRLDAELACGRGAELVPEIETFVLEWPLRERLRAQLMLALYRAGRQAEALEAFQRAREALVEELGIDPGPEFQALHRQILNQDPSLKAAAAARPELPSGTVTLMATDIEASTLALRALGSAAYATAHGGIPADPRSPRKHQDRPVTPEVAGSSPVAPVFRTPKTCKLASSVAHQGANDRRSLFHPAYLPHGNRRREAGHSR
jgi:DNA-binding SARP family transcriptional activator